MGRVDGAEVSQSLYAALALFIYKVILPLYSLTANSHVCGLDSGLAFCGVLESPWLAEEPLSLLWGFCSQLKGSQANVVL